MSDKRIYLKDETAKLVTEGAPAIWLPWPKQPPNYYTYLGTDNNAANFFNNTGLGDFGKSYFFPCQPGDTARLLETWRVWLYNPLNQALIIEYKDGSRKDIPPGLMGTNFKLQHCSLDKWRSPVTMPNIACRNVWMVGKVEALNPLDTGDNDVRLCHINKLLPQTKDMKCIETRKAFVDWFHTTYPNPLDSWGWYVEQSIEEK